MLANQDTFKIHNSEICLQVQRNIDADKIQELEDTVEILKEQIESLKLELCYKNHELEEMQKELNYTSRELCVLNELYATSFKPLPINKVKKLSESLLASKKLIKDIAS